MLEHLSSGFNGLVTYLSDHPHVGAISGFGSGVFMSANGFFMDEGILRIISVFGVWMGFLIATMTIIIKAFDFYKFLEKRFRR